MLGGWTFWAILLAGTFWSLLGPVRFREAGLAVLAFALVMTRDAAAGGAYLVAVVAVWALVRHGKPKLYPAAVTVVALACGLLASEILENLDGDDWWSPLGLSYLVFRLIHVVVDARRQLWKEPPRLMEFLHFMFTPALFVAGPLERWGHWNEKPDLATGRRLSTGTWRIVIGLLKKVYVADLFLHGLAERTGWTIPSTMGPDAGSADVWQACIFTYLKIYIEFSGYTDIAIGAALLWGRRPMENFNWPVIAATTSDFWRRWHISMAQWCSNCVYLPVMGLARGVAVPLLSSFIVMGLWHGLTWNRIGWALWHVAGLLLFIYWQKWRGRPKAGTWRAGKPWRAASILMTQAFVSASYVFVMHGEEISVAESLGLIAKMLGLKS